MKGAAGVNGGVERAEGDGVPVGGEVAETCIEGGGGEGGHLQVLWERIRGLQSVTDASQIWELRSHRLLACTKSELVQGTYSTTHRC